MIQNSVAQLAPLILLITVAILSWDILLAGWMAARREAPRVFTHLTSICGLLVAPALVIAVAAGTESGARTVAGIAWLLPIVCTAFVLQVFYALAVGLVSPVIAIPILIYDSIVTAVAVGDFLVSQYGTAPLALQAVVSARDVVMGMTIGRAALVSPWAILVPIIAPAYPARWRLSALARVTIVLTATAVSTLLVIEWPRGVAAVRSYDQPQATSFQPRPNGDYKIGMRFLPVLSGPPRAQTVKADYALAATFGPDVVMVVLDLDATRSATLDSVATVLSRFRSDSVLIAVGLHHGRSLMAPNDPSYASAVERVLERLRPAVLFPAIGDPVPSVLPSDSPTAQWWSVLMRTADAVRKRVRPATQLGVTLSRLDGRDSAVYAWAAGAGATVDIIGTVVYPSYSGMAGVDARLRALERWRTRSLDSTATEAPVDTATEAPVDTATEAPVDTTKMPAHWLVNVGGLPHAHGDNAQLAAMRHTVIWGSRRPWIHAVIIGESADYDGWLGVRAANGRVRRAWDAMSQLKKTLGGDY